MAAFVAGLLPAASLDAQAPPRRDDRQNVRATSASRICTYQERRVTSAGRRQVRVLVGRGEPCPTTAPLQRPAVATVPPFAQLADQGRVRNKQVCTYAYLGTRYTRTIDYGLSCPITPNIR